MYQCKNCGTEFEGNFCPECGTKREDRTCRGCGAPLAPSAKFCSECGLPADDCVPAEKATAPEEHVPAYAEKPHVPVSHVRVSAPFFTEDRLRSIYKISAVLPLALCGLFSFLTFMFCFAPAAEVKDILFGTGSQSLGSVYDLSDASSSAVLAFAAIGLAVALVGCLFLFVKRLAWHEIPRSDIPLYEPISWLFQAVWIGAFVSACVICAEVQEMDGSGAISVGAGPILIIVFSVLFGLLAAGIQSWRKKFLAEKIPVFPEEERALRAEWRERYATPKTKTNADDGKNKLLGRVRSVLRLKWACPWLVCGGAGVVVVGIRYIGNLILDFPRFFGVALIIVGLIFLVKKKQIIGEKASRAPLEYLRKNRASMIACAVAYSFFAVAYLVFGSVFVFGSSPMFSAEGEGLDSLALQLGQISESNYIENWVNIAIYPLFALGYFLLSVSSCTCAVACKQLPAQMTEITDYAENTALLKREIARTPSFPRVRRMWAGFLTVATSVILVITIVIGTAVSSNIFLESKFYEIDIGASQSRVADILGRADVESTGEWYYYSDNAVSLMRKQNELDRELEAALIKGDERRIEAIDGEIAALAEEAKGMRYRVIRVLFDANSTVTRAEMLNSGMTDTSGKRHTAEATLSPASVSYEHFAATAFTYTAEYSSNYVRARLGYMEVFSDPGRYHSTSINGPGTYYLKWTDSLFDYYATLKVT